MDPTLELQRVAEGYRAQGYDITVGPEPDQLPAFARDFRVEIVGRRGAEGVLVAVRKNREALAADRDVQRYAEVTGAQPGWRFDFAILEAEDMRARELSGARESSAADIARVLDQAAKLSSGDLSQFAVVAAWSALEAAMRMRLRAMNRGAGWGSPPRQMVRELYSAGAIPPDEFRFIESASQLRNEIVHGFAPEPRGAADSVAAARRLGEIARRFVDESQLAGQAA